MAQHKWEMPATSSDNAYNALLTQFPHAFENLRSLHGGALDPATPANEIGSVKWMLWADEGNSMLQMRNAGDSAWLEIGPLEAHLGMLRVDGANPMAADLDLDGNALLDPEWAGAGSASPGTPDDCMIVYKGATPYYVPAYLAVPS
ncbi:MAG: hypothetical protein JXQ29_08410 [Planctomycetes bacterium]|nr:hypothetical protein [Planctomycetota bacterium]